MTVILLRIALAVALVAVVVLALLLRGAYTNRRALAAMLDARNETIRHLLIENAHVTTSLFEQLSSNEKLHARIIAERRVAHLRNRDDAHREYVALVDVVSGAGDPR